MAPELGERAVSWWRRFGLRKAAMILLVVLGPLIRYEYLPHTLSGTLETVAEGYGLDLRVGEWETSLGDVSVTARNVTIAAPGAFTSPALFTANAVVLDWSLVRGLRNARRRLAACWTAVFLQPCTVPDEALHRVRIEGGVLHLERLRSGVWNVDSAFNPDDLASLIETVGRIRVGAIEAEDLRVDWIEHVAGDSGGGVIEQRLAELHFDAVHLAVDGLQLPVDDGSGGAEVNISGRSADGTFAIKGRFNPGRWARTAPAGAATRAAEAGDGPDSWTPSFALTATLDNVGAATLGRFVPEATLMPRRGSVDGHIELARDATPFSCHVALDLKDVSYAANPRSPYVRARGAGLDASLQRVVVNDHLEQDCRGLWEPTAGTRPGAALQAAITHDALRNGPPDVAAAATYQQVSLVQGPERAMAAYASELSASLGGKVAGEAGASVARALTAPAANGGNVVTRGARSVGRGVKRLFGGGKK